MGESRILAGNFTLLLVTLSSLRCLRMDGNYVAECSHLIWFSPCLGVYWEPDVQQSYGEDGHIGSVLARGKGRIGMRGGGGAGAGGAGKLLPGPKRYLDTYITYRYTSVQIALLLYIL